jgi:hypothetical protein
MISHAQEVQTEVEFDQAQPTICRGRGHRDEAANPSASTEIGRLLVAKTVFSLRLLRAYTAIKDKAVQRRFVILVEMIAASQR